MSQLSSLMRRAKLACERSLELYRNANTASSPLHELLSSAFLELGIVSEALETAIAELVHQTEQMSIIQNELDAERRRYLDLFELMPDGYFVTDTNAVILDVNRVGASLVNAKPHALIGQPFASLIYSEDLPLFQLRLTHTLQKCQVDNRVNFSVRLYRQVSSHFHAALTANVLRKQNGEIAYMQWMLRDDTERKRAEAALENPHYNPGCDRPLIQFSRGENIPLESHIVWWVTSGVVKITTLSERGEETLVGLIGSPMVFGSSLTALPVYQAIALSDVTLAAISLPEIGQSPQLAQALLQSLTQRLQQSESLLAINGQIRVEERLTSLLTLLKQAIGKPVEHGVRLQARFTHHDFAQACRTTRVTVTRLLGKLQEQGKLVPDAKHHLILKE